MAIPNQYRRYTFNNQPSEHHRFKRPENIKSMDENKRPNHKESITGEGWHGKMERSNAAYVSAINRRSPNTFARERNI